MIDERWAWISRNKRTLPISLSASIGILLFFRLIDDTCEEFLRLFSCIERRTPNTPDPVCLAPSDDISIVRPADIETVHEVETKPGDYIYIVVAPTLHIHPGIRADQEQLLAVKLESAVFWLWALAIIILDKLHRTNLARAQTGSARREFLLEHDQLSRVFIDADIHIAAIARVDLFLFRSKIYNLVCRQVGAHKFKEIPGHRLHAIEVDIAGVVRQRGI